MHGFDAGPPPDHGASHAARIRAYYQATWHEYRCLWFTRQTYAIHFGYWDEHTRGHGQALRNMNHRLAQALGIQPGQRVLDAGCGVGESAIWLTQTLGAQVVGITLVPRQVERARHYAQVAGVAGRVTFDQQDYTHTSFPDHSFDHVWALESVCHAPDKHAFVVEAQRLLRPGGRLGIIDYWRTRRPHAPKDERLLHRWLAGWAIPDLATGDEIVAATRAAGFAEVQFVDHTRHVRPSLRRLYGIATLLGPGEAVLYTLGLRSALQHGNARGARDQYRALRRGLWFHGVLTGALAAG